MCREIRQPEHPPARYSGRPLPPYRYVPGLHPHPVAHADGHSHDPSGAHPAAGPLRPPEEWRACDDYLFGADLYNQAYWWEAHEAWEGIWQQSDKRGPQGHFLQFLIQVAACHLQRHMGHEDGVERLRARAFGHLDQVLAGLPAGTSYMGLDLGHFASDVRRFLDGASDAFPFLVLDLRDPPSRPPGKPSSPAA